MERKPGTTRAVRKDREKGAHRESGPGGGGGAGTPRDAEFSALAIRYLDATVGPRHDQFAAVAGITPAQLSLYRYGHTVPRPESMARFAERVGLPLEWIEAMTADAILLRGRNAGTSAGESAGETAETLTRRLVGQLAPRLAALHSTAPASPLPPPALERAEEDRAEAARRWTQIAPLTAAERAAIVLEIPTLHSWAFVEHLCRQSAKTETPAEALALARLAVRLAPNVHASPGFRDRLNGYALLHLAHTLRAIRDLPRAREAQARGARLFEAGRADDPGLLEPPAAGAAPPAQP